MSDHPGIHALALVHDDVTIGAGTKVWQFVSVIRGAVLGADCNIASGATIDGAFIGDRCIVCHNVLIPPGVHLGSDIFVGPNTTICNDRWPRTDKAGFDIDALRAGHWTVIVRDGASIGAHAVILPGVVIGAGTMVAAGAVAERNVPDNHLLRRDGVLVAIKPQWRTRRTRFCSSSQP